MNLNFQGRVLLTKIKSILQIDQNDLTPIKIVSTQLKFYTYTYKFMHNVSKYI